MGRLGLLAGVLWFRGPLIKRPDVARACPRVVGRPGMVVSETIVRGGGAPTAGLLQLCDVWTAGISRDLLDAGSFSGITHLQSVSHYRTGTTFQVDRIEGGRKA
jgi:hypothetical protein